MHTRQHIGNPPTDVYMLLTEACGQIESPDIAFSMADRAALAGDREPAGTLITWLQTRRCKEHDLDLARS